MTNLPKAPQNEGVDPLTKGKRYHNDNTKADSTFNDAPAQVETETTERSEQTLADQEARNAEANTPSTEPDVEVTGNNEDGSVEANVDGEPTTLTPADEETQTAVETDEGSDTAEAEQPSA